MQPNLTFYYGRTVERVEINEGGDGGEWAIVLEGDVRIENFDENYDVPEKALEGQKFSMAIFESSVTRLYFGTDENPRSTVMHLNPTEYGISDPAFGGGIVRPQSTEDERAEAGFEASAPGERIVDGPSEEFYAGAAGAEKPEEDEGEVDPQ